VGDPLLAGVEPEEGDPVLARVAFERREHLLGLVVRQGALAFFRLRRRDVVGRRERPVGVRDVEFALAEHPERLRTGDLVHEVEADEQLVLAVRQLRTL
jgi:hypothetical protein